MDRLMKISFTVYSTTSSRLNLLDLGIGDTLVSARRKTDVRSGPRLNQRSESRLTSVDGAAGGSIIRSFPLAVRHAVIYGDLCLVKRCGEGVSRYAAQDGRYEQPERRGNIAA